MSTRTLVILLVLATIAAYVSVFASGTSEFVFDDFRFIKNNEAVKDLGQAGRYFTDPSTVDSDDWVGIYRPLRTLDFAIDWAITAPFEDPGKVLWFHFRSLLYHVIVVLLAFGLFRKWGASDPAATLGALVFALHPVNVESVAWITSRADVLFLVLLLWALRQHGKSGGLDRKFLGATVLLALALLAKEAAVVFVGLAVLTDFFFRDDRRIRVTLRRAPQYAVYGVLALAYFLTWKGFHDAAGENWWHLTVRWGGSLWGTVLTMSRGFVYYVRLLFLPVDMSQDWYLLQVSTPDLLTVACLVAVVGLLIVGIVRAFTRGGSASFAILWFFVAIFPASNLVAPIGIPTAERFLYLPLVGVAFALGILLGRIWSGGLFARAVTVLLLLCLGLVSADRASIWTSNERLWTRTAARFESPRSLNWHGKMDRLRGEKFQRLRRELVDEDRIAEAVEAATLSREAFERALASYSREVEVWRAVLPVSWGPVALARAHRSICMSGLQRHSEALAEAEAALRIWPGNFHCLAARARAEYGLGSFRVAARSIEASLAQRDLGENRANAAAIYEKLGILYEQAGNRARSYLSLKRSWDHLPDPRRNSGVAEALERMEAEYVRRAGPLGKRVDENPQDWNSWLELAIVYASHGYWEKSEQIFHGLLKSERPESGDPYALFPYALYQWQWQDTEEGYLEAVRIYTLILEGQPDHELALRERSRCEEELRRLRDL